MVWSMMCCSLPLLPLPGKDSLSHNIKTTLEYLAKTNTIAKTIAILDIQRQKQWLQQFLCSKKNKEFDFYLTNKEASTVLCSVVKHARSGTARKKCRGKHET